MDALETLNAAAYAAIRAHRRAPRQIKSRLLAVAAEIDRIIDGKPPRTDPVVAAYERALIDMGLNPASLAAEALKAKEGAQ